MTDHSTWPEARWRHLILGGLCVVWLALQLGFFYKLGVRHLGDTGRYLHAAERILSGSLPAGKAASYLGYDFFVALFLGMHLGTKSIAAAQAVVAFGALLALYGVGTRLHDARVGLTAVTAYVLFPDVGYWHCAILTDSLYASMIIISTWLAVSAASAPGVLAALVSFCFTCTIRPHGVGFAVSGFLFLLCSLAAAGRWRALVLVLVCAAVAAPAAWIVVGDMSAHENILRHYLDGTVIWGYPDANISALSEARAAHARGLHPIIAIVLYMVREPMHFWTLALERVGYFLAHARPSFTWYHNLISLAVLLPAYALAAWSVVKVPARRHCGKVFIVSTFAAQASIVAVTFADWDARHLVPVLSVVFLLASAGLWDILDRIRGPAPSRKRG